MHGYSAGSGGGRRGYYRSAIMAIVSGVSGGGGVLSATADGHCGTRHRHTASHVT